MKKKVDKYITSSIPYRFYIECTREYPRLADSKNKTTGSCAIRSAWGMVAMEKMSSIYPKINIMAIISRDHAISNHIQDKHEFDYNTFYSDYSILYTRWYDVFSEVWNNSKSKKIYDVELMELI